jgi:hypothetical protein
MQSHSFLGDPILSRALPIFHHLTFRFASGFIPFPSRLREDFLHGLFLSSFMEALFGGMM